MMPKRKFSRLAWLTFPAAAAIAAPLTAACGSSWPMHSPGKPSDALYAKYASLSDSFPSVFENDGTAATGRHTFCFVGGAHMSGSLASLGGGFRNYPGQFEECVRGFWNNVGGNSDTVLNQLQRYVFDDSYAGCSLADVLNDWQRVQETDPETVVYLVGPEDYVAGDAGVGAFKARITDLISQATSLRGGAGYVVIQKHWATGNGTIDSLISKYNAAVEAAIDEAAAEGLPLDRVVVVDHFTATTAGGEDYLGRNFSEDDENPDGSLNAYGQSEIGRQLAQGTYGYAMTALTANLGRFGQYKVTDGEDADISWGHLSIAGLVDDNGIDFSRTPQPTVWGPDGGSGLVGDGNVAWQMPAGFEGLVKGYATREKPSVSASAQNLSVSLPASAGSGSFNWRLLVEADSGPYYVDGVAEVGEPGAPFTISGLPATGNWRLKVFTADGRQLPVVYGDMALGSAGTSADAHAASLSDFQRAVQAKAAASPGGLVWAAVGDSITQGSAYAYGWDSSAQQFIRSLREDYGRAKDTFLNLAIWGNATNEELYRAPQRFMAYSPDVAIIALGINDLARPIDPNGGQLSGATPGQIAGNIARIVGMLRQKNPQVAVLINSVLPVGESVSTPNGSVADTNELLRETAAALNTKASPVGYCNLYDQLLQGVLPARSYYLEQGKTAFFNFDEIHMVPEGQNWRADRWLDAFGFDPADSETAYLSWANLGQKEGGAAPTVSYDPSDTSMKVDVGALETDEYGSVLVRAVDQTTGYTYSATANLAADADGRTAWDKTFVSFPLHESSSHAFKVECVAYGRADASASVMPVVSGIPGQGFA